MTDTNLAAGTDGDERTAQTFPRLSDEMERRVAGYGNRGDPAGG